jgi:hypothetical protein
MFLKNSWAKKILWIPPHLKSRDSRIPGFGILFKNSNSGDFLSYKYVPYIHEKLPQFRGQYKMQRYSPKNIYGEQPLKCRILQKHFYTTFS